MGTHQLAAVYGFTTSLNTTSSMKHNQ